MKKIQILGTGCSKCKKLYEAVKSVIADSKDFEVEKITDIMKIMKFDVIVTPALAIDGKVMFSGSIPSTGELKQLLFEDEGCCADKNVCSIDCKDGECNGGCC